MYLLDTNVVSERMKAQPNPAVIGWLDAKKAELYLPSVALDELRYGVLRLPEGRRREGFARAVEALVTSYADKICRSMRRRLGSLPSFDGRRTCWGSIRASRT